MHSSTARDPIVQHLRSHLPGLLAIYAFGSRITGNATPQRRPGHPALTHGEAVKPCFSTTVGLARHRHP